MECKDFLQCFYKKEGGIIVGGKSYAKVGEFFFKNGVVLGENDYLPESGSTYEKWVTGKRIPDSSNWAVVLKCLDEEKLEKALIEKLNDNTLEIVLNRFGVNFESGETANKVQAAKAFTAMFKAIASGNGSSRNIVPEEYKKPPELKGFETYIREAKRKFSKIKLPGGEERLLSDYFVCNSIGKTAAAFPFRTRTETIEEATLSKILLSGHGKVFRHSYLIGACGYGKTLMLQHLFIDAADHLIETGILPFFAELRNYTESHGDLVAFIAECAKEFDEGFTQEKVKKLLQRGQAAILFDGLDEMNPDETKFFQKELSKLCHHYPSCQIVISSRQCSAIKGIWEFIPLYLHPLNEEQSQKLIENLLVDVEDKDAKTTILSFTDTQKGYFKKNGFLATNPMLLTIMVEHYEKLRDCAGDKAKFYEIMYEALIREHDEEKESFDRFFHSVSNGDEFTQVFRELCAISYVDGVDQFSSIQFEKYFKKLKTKQELQNPSIFQLSKFQQDVCATACVMYEQERDIFYIDPGLQDYLFSEYYYLEETEATKEMGNALRRRNIDSFRNLDALKMLYKLAPEKVHVCVLLPFLDAIFKAKTDDDAFLRFLSFGFGDVTYTLLDKPRIDEYKEKPPTSESFDFIPIANSPKNILMGLLLDHLDVDNTFVIGALDEHIQKNKYTKYFICGYHDTVIDTSNPNDRNSEHILLRGRPEDIRYIDDTEYYQHGYAPLPLIDESGKSVCFGFVYVVGPLSLNEDPNQRKELLELCERTPIRDIFKQVKQFYIEIARKQEVNNYQ